MQETKQMDRKKVLMKINNKCQNLKIINTFFNCTYSEKPMGQCWPCWSQSSDQPKSQVTTNSSDGLPNIGNTCYLNVILQMIYSASELRKLVSSTSKQFPTLQFHRLLYQILRDLEFPSTVGQKQSHLEDFRRCLQKKQPRFIRFEQCDAMQCFLSILNILDEELSSQNNHDLFKLEYSQTCNCPKRPELFEEFIISSHNRCNDCKKQFDLTIISSGKYLIHLQNDKYKFSQKKRFPGKQSEYEYEIKSFVVYTGNKKSGHYISYRKAVDGKKWLRISDSHVQVIESLQFDRQSPMLSLYEKIN